MTRNANQRERNQWLQHQISAAGDRVDHVNILVSHGEPDRAEVVSEHPPELACPNDIWEDRLGKRHHWNGHAWVQTSIGNITVNVPTGVSAIDWTNVKNSLLDKLKIEDFVGLHKTTFGPSLSSGESMIAKGLADLKPGMSTRDIDCEADARKWESEIFKRLVKEQKLKEQIALEEKLIQQQQLQKLKEQMIANPKSDTPETPTDEAW